MRLEHEITQALSDPSSLGKYKKLATATNIPRLEKYINEFAYSTNYHVDPETLEITNPLKAPPASWFVMRHRGGYLFGIRE